MGLYSIILILVMSISPRSLMVEISDRHVSIFRGQWFFLEGHQLVCQLGGNPQVMHGSLIYLVDNSITRMVFSSVVSLYHTAF